MKFNLTLLSKSTRRSSAFIAILGIAVAFTSCKSDVQAPQSVAGVAITNASPTNNSLDFYINNQRVNTNALVFGQRIDYVSAYPGTSSATVTASGDTKALYTGNFTLIAGQYHSLYILSKGDSISYLTIRDTISTPPANTAKVRFINLVSDAPAYNLEISNDTTAFSNRAYKTYTSFKNVKPQIVKLTLRDKNTNAVVASLENIEFKDQKFYTVWAKGLVNTTVAEQKLSIQVSQHFQ